MRFTIEVGDVEKHLVEYHFNPLLGTLVVKVDDKPVRKHVRLVNEPVRETHALTVGERERHDIRFERERTSTFTRCNRVYVNNRLLKVVGKKGKKA
jgi:hypothetical protein